MSRPRFSDDFKRDAVHQIVERGYSIAEVSQRLGMSTHSLYAWVKKYSTPDASSSSDEQATEIRRLKNELMRVTEERDWPLLQVSKLRSATSVVRAAMAANHLSL